MASREKDHQHFLAASGEADEDMEGIDYRRESAPYHHKTSIGASGQIGETPMLETAETLKNTTDTHLQFYDRDTQQHMIESVKDFPHHEDAGSPGVTLINDHPTYKQA